MNALVTKLHNQKTFKNPKNLVLFDWNIWDYVGLFSCSPETISGINTVYHTIGEIGDGDRLMLCSKQHNRGILEEISIGTS